LLLFKVLNSSLLFYKFVVLVINVLTKVIKFIIKKLIIIIIVSYAYQLNAMRNYSLSG
jgi:hypothetical protein